jgi:hypothetical protein
MTGDQSKRLADLMLKLPTPTDMKELMALVDEIEQMARNEWISRVKNGLQNHNGPGYAG